MLISAFTANGSIDTPRDGKKIPKPVEKPCKINNQTGSTVKKIHGI